MPQKDDCSSMVDGHEDGGAGQCDGTMSIIYDESGSSWPMSLDQGRSHHLPAMPATRVFESGFRTEPGERAFPE